MTSAPPEGSSTRGKILWAALTLLGERAGSIASVRAIAARAGVSTGALQHHFPAKQDLVDEVMTVVYDTVLPSDYLEDTSVPARDRLISCLEQVVSPNGVDVPPRQAWQVTYERYLSPEASEDARMEYSAIERELCRRIEQCLIALHRERAVPAGDHARTARALLTVALGVSVTRALPHGEHTASTATDVLHAAADAVLTAPAGQDLSSDV
ncbi:TetR/AcrR family transcriptional regulator [Brachybacterium sacelli]|uniref:AcrR family transcriptional regulator n=1 Tax=Brachybacterium sacelli TaxID=173364 RepID=A0ABS4X5F8_9MICO|nr:TetR/AcrR family transcriptional regulator [Brachybacterium sacelli]MBP2382959.1 AcrR family transcriptional regulator [Brachybacterium sacelli]